jgi:hypothetical protein
MRLFLLMFLIFSAFAQDTTQPPKEELADLRGTQVVFSIENLSSDRKIWLERTANLDHFLRMQEDDQGEKTQKISTKDAKKMDLEFSAKFLKCQYELSFTSGDCDVTLRLTLKGETQDVCKKDDKKTQEIIPFFNELQKRF